MAKNKVQAKASEQPVAKLKIRSTVKVGLTCRELKTIYERDRVNHRTLADYWKSQMSEQGCPSL